MNKHIILFFILLSLHGTKSLAQYISTVSYPDKNITKSTETNDPSYRIASMISSESLKKHLYILASDSMEGRETGQKGIQQASAYLQAAIQNAGLLKPPGAEGHFQNVALTFSKWKETSITANKTRYRHLWDYIMIHESNVSIPVLNTNEVVFLGYGIDDPKYSDYKKQM
ncbi:MAG: hypothetical protein IPJ13_05655 [Saprospiraceae bacterium]|nr:hypothetical protein [Saprospiraceae bacterium]